jgi:hypothetical protein
MKLFRKFSQIHTPLVLLALAGALSSTACNPISKAGDVAGAGPVPIPSPSADHGDYSIAVSWNANHETAVNASGGGYRVYYSKTSPVNTGGSGYAGVPYTSGPLAPNSVTLYGLTAGTYYLRVVAYSKLSAPGSSSSSSPDSQEISITVP